MRVAPVLGAVALLFALPAPVSLGEQTTEREARVTDPSGDLTLVQGGSNVSSMPASHPHVDLRSAWLANETIDEFEVGFGLQSWNDPLYGEVTGRFVQVSFVFGGEAYKIHYGPYIDGSYCPLDQATFSPGDADSGLLHFIECLPVDVDEAAAVARVEVPKALLKSSSFLAPQVGDNLTKLTAVSRQLTGFGWVLDRAPDEGYGNAFPLREGVAERGGDLYMKADVPVRASNGESTTMVFQVLVGNDGKEEKIAVVSAREDNKDWAVRLPPRVRIPGGGAVDVPVILSMNFTHDHDRTEYFRVRAEDVNDPSNWAAIELGVHWLDIPQPAGHHDKLYLHSRPNRGANMGVPSSGTLIGDTVSWMNANPTDDTPGTTDEPVPGYDVAQPGTPTRWEFPLLPRLQIGLDLDPTRPGMFETNLHAYAPATNARLVAEVVFCDSSGRIPGRGDAYCGSSDQPGTLVVMLSGESAPRALAANADHAFAFELTPNATAEILPFTPGSDLRLELMLIANTPQSATIIGHPPTATLDPKASVLTLPLHEYHDPIDQAFLDVGTLRLTALDPHEKRVNPGRGAVFRFDLTNVGSTDQRVALSAEGINADWASVHEGTSLVVPSQETKQVSLIVRAPDEAVAGERAELFLVAESLTEPSIVALGRVRASVIDLTTLEIPDEAASLSPQAQSKGTPGFELGLALLAMCLLTLFSRRR